MLSRAKRIEEQLIEREERKSKDELVQQEAARQQELRRQQQQAKEDEERAAGRGRFGFDGGEEAGHLEGRLTQLKKMEQDPVGTTSSSPPPAAQAGERSTRKRSGSAESMSGGESSSDAHDPYSRVDRITASLHGSRAVRSRSGTPDLSTEDIDGQADDATDGLEARLNALRSVGGAAQSIDIPGDLGDGRATYDLDAFDSELRANAGDPNTPMPGRTPTASDSRLRGQQSMFDQQYPTLDDFETSLGSRGPPTPYGIVPEEHDEGGPAFPGIPSHKPGSTAAVNGSSSALSAPPKAPTELIGAVPSSASATSNGLPRNRAPVPAGFKVPSSSSSPATQAIENGSKAAAAPPSPGTQQSLAGPGAGDGTYGTKPPPPMSVHIKAPELWQILNPGFASVQEKAADGRLRQVVVKKKGLKVLLLDIRTREVFEKSRIAAKHVVCLEPLMLKPECVAEVNLLPVKSLTLSPTLSG